MPIITIPTITGGLSTSMGLSSNNPTTPSSILYAGCLDADPHVSLKYYDGEVVSRLMKRGAVIDQLAKRIPSTRQFVKISRNLLYPHLISKTTKASENVLHIGSECYADLVRVAKCPTVVTCHGLYEHYYPQERSKTQMRRWYKRRRYLKQADLVFAVSDFLKSDLIKLFDVPPEKIVVNHEGVSGIFSPSVGTLEVPWLGRLKDLSHNHFLILSVGTNLYVKNMGCLLEAVQELRRRGVPALIVKAGDRLMASHRRIIQDMEMTSSVVDFGYLGSKELGLLYRHCHVLSFPSLYEGFGLPVLEAQQSGLPCVISSAGSLPEIGGEAALYHDPEDAAQLVSQLQRVYEDQQLRSGLIEQGFKNAERFSWDKHVNTLLEEWSRLINHGCSSTK